MRSPTGKHGIPGISIVLNNLGNGFEIVTGSLRLPSERACYRRRRLFYDGMTFSGAAIVKKDSRKRKEVTAR